MLIISISYFRDCCQSKALAICFYTRPQNHLLVEYIQLGPICLLMNRQFMRSVARQILLEMKIFTMKKCQILLGTSIYQLIYENNFHNFIIDSFLLLDSLVDIYV